MKGLEHFPVIDWDRSVGEAAETIALNQARGAVVRKGGNFSLVGWRDVAKTLADSKDKPLGKIVSIEIAADMVSGKVAHIDIGKLPNLRDFGALIKATLYKCETCGYLGERENADCAYTPCGQKKL
ncbi:MAG: hypothetical protein ACLPGW_19255 [Roseiarcus sp.]